MIEGRFNVVIGGRQVGARRTDEQTRSVSPAKVITGVMRGPVKRNAVPVTCGACCNRGPNHYVESIRKGRAND